MSRALFCSSVFVADSPRRIIVLHWASFLASLLGICSLVVARGHYSIDVLLAYFVTSRLWWIYHTLATNPSLKQRTEENILSSAWWFFIFQYFEKNVPSRLPRRYSLPMMSTLRRVMHCEGRWARCRGRGEEGELIDEEGEVEVKGVPWVEWCDKL